MKILLTGASGFTGRPFAEMARAAGHQVVVLDCDLADKTALRQQVLAAAPDSVVHLAAISFVGQADENAFYAVNVVGTLNLLDAVLALPQAPQRILLASSANVYGNCDASPITESQPPAPMNHYATSKLAMEHMARTYGDRLSLLFTRPFNYTGVGQASQFLIPKLVNHFARRAPGIELGNLHVEREFNDVDMVCAAYLQLLEHGQPGETYNICSGNAYTLQHVIALLSQITGHQIDVTVNPAFVRVGEVHRLCGSPAKLQALPALQGGPLLSRSLEDTLRHMLAAAEREHQALLAAAHNGPRT
ncbi:MULTISPECIES: GDP-mannose 4,6-dehydratase [unclassified Janthinobacterium]|uniref:GDP-mannose 4,6-dehydratase n=1 Tax=unclassified Janthinobacterium TaxID=2610881 RepID=UPI00161BB54E|nr:MULTISPECIES: GDP-mannose 4,6-dehydratase [unclassified Janthinobacterium]MBB5371107.1 nucleoside-diphosphate-sugar epimerase [Janthinobacterium sp. K2C7]MBB5383913.1 nucleoside-diphosphate-sugar epimerase [Janthinobacterium sp. K2Li3]MBB5389265.1 nucleoside-diphosphate-sugar epimerase [Janthinobacterium sp. K2E3]